MPRTKKRALPTIADIADHFLCEAGYYDGKFPQLFYWRGCFYHWLGKHFVKNHDDDIRAKVICYIRDRADIRRLATPTHCKALIENLKGMCNIPSSVEMPSWCSVDPEVSLGTIDHDKWVDAPLLISLRNGILDVEAYLQGREDCLRPNSPRLFSTVTLPYEFDMHAKCPRWQKFLNEVLPDAALQKLLQEWIGYCLTHDTKQQKFLLMVGEGANGKTVVCEITILLLGKENVSSVALEQFGQTHAPVGMLGKLANIVSEIGEITKVSEGQLKSMVSGDLIQLNEKFKPVFSAHQTARLMFATNNLPRFTDRTDGIWRRMILLQFTKTFAENEQDKQLVAKLSAELPGIFIWALNGLKSLEKRGYFEEPEASKRLKVDYRRESNPVTIFFEEKCEFSESVKIRCIDLYTAYDEWCSSNGYKPLSDGQFGKELKRQYPKCVRSLLRNDGDRAPYYQGVQTFEAVWPTDIKKRVVEPAESSIGNADGLPF